MVKRKIISPALVFILLSGFFCAPAPASAAAPAVSAAPTSSAVLVNGIITAFDAYNIEDSNYFKLRDLAYVLNGTEKQFEVGWNAAGDFITITTGLPYKAVGGEMAGGGAGDKTPAPTGSVIYLDGEAVTFTAYNIGGNNYFKLRDIGAALGFGVDWDSAANTVVVDTSRGYAPDGGETPAPSSDKPVWPETEIIGNADFISATQKALDLIKESDSGYSLVTNYVAVIEQNSFSGMRAYDDPPVYQVGNATYSASTTWYASSIVHDAYHSKLYRDSLEKNGYADSGAWTGADAEAQCLSVQIDFLIEIGAPQHEIDHAVSIIDTEYWKTEDRWW